MTNYKLSIDDTFCLKGIAICGMLCWHLFFCPNPLNVQFDSLARFIGVIGDVCVSIFLFLSGYGLMQSWQKSNSEALGSRGAVLFVLKRLVKFYSNFWFVFLIFVPLGVFVFGINLLQDGNFLHRTIHFVLQLLGLTGQQSYNTTWWFNSLIIPLYLLFPVIAYTIKRFPCYLCFLVFIICNLQFHIGYQMGPYLPIFVIGVLASAYHDNISNFMQRYEKGNIVFILFLTLIGALIVLYSLGEEHIYRRGIFCYLVLTLQFTLFTILFLRKTKYLYIILSFLGKHSMNIYYVHTFLNYYWFPHIVYSINNSCLVWTGMMACSVVISIFLEYAKRITRWSVLPTLLNPIFNHM